MPLERGATPRKLLADSFVERDARISPDGRWLAYVSDESGRPEVSVRSLAGPSRRFVVSSGGGDQPVWSHDGAELFFAAARGSLYSVSVRPDAKDGLAFGTMSRLRVPAPVSARILEFQRREPRLRRLRRGGDSARQSRDVIGVLGRFPTAPAAI